MQAMLDKEVRGGGIGTSQSSIESVDSVAVCYPDETVGICNDRLHDGSGNRFTDSIGGRCKST